MTGSGPEPLRLWASLRPAIVSTHGQTPEVVRSVHDFL